MQPLKRIRPSPRGARGFTLVEIMIVIFIIGVLMNIAAPALIGARDNSQSKACIANLKRFQGAKEQYAYDNRINATSSTAITWPNIAGYLRYPNANPVTGPTCPTEGDAYNYGTLSQNPTCSYGGPVGNPSLAHVLK
jgi:prepilin-type N-terminal cleavage/methylation domain-containing protein